MTFLEAMKALIAGKKITCSVWKGSGEEGQYLYIEDEKIKAKFGCVEFGWYDIQQEWELYEELNEKKKYWLWSFRFKNTEWYKNHYYLDDNGYNTTGVSYFSDWDSLEKIKHENEFIEV